MHRTNTRTAACASAAALVLLAIGGCGSETGDPGSGEASGGPGGAFDVSSATLTDEPFCDRVDTGLVGGVLGLAPEKVKTQVDRAVGDEFEGMDEEAGPATSVANLCVFGSSTSQFLVSVQPDATSGDVQESIDELASLAGKGSSETCENVDGSAFGDPAAAFTCTSDRPIKRVRVAVTGLVGDSKFYCAASLNQGAGPEFPETSVDACRTLLEELATPA